MKGSLNGQKAAGAGNSDSYRIRQVFDEIDLGSWGVFNIPIDGHYSNGISSGRDVVEGCLTALHLKDRFRPPDPGGDVSLRKQLRLELEELLGDDLDGIITQMTSIDTFAELG